MNGGTITATQVIGNGLERDHLMLPSHPHPSTSKRKTDDSSNPLLNASKKLKTSSNKRKHVGEEQPGGLVIIRAPSTRSPSEDPHGNRHPPRASPFPSNPLPNGTSSKPPSKKLRSDIPDIHTNSKERDKPPNSRSGLVDTDEDAQQSEDVRRMQSETDTLRRRSRPPETINPAFQFPASSSNSNGVSKGLKAPSQQRGRIREMSQPLPLQETPEIRKNKLLRGESVGKTRRKSSLSRGKRISSTFENTGVIAQPHTAVRDSSFYKHIDVELPEPQRAQQLLIWCSHRAMNELVEKNTQAATASSSLPNGKDPGKDPPPLSAADMMLVKGVEENLVRMLAEKRIDTNVYSPPDDGETSMVLKENEGNMRNRAREARFNAHIQKLKLEDEKWTEVGSSYNAFRSQVLAELEERRKEFPSAKAKGKQRLSEEERGEDVDLWDISEADLPEHFRGKEGLDLARSIAKGEQLQQDTLAGRLAELEFIADRLHTLTHSALKTTRISETDLNRRFATLHSFLAARSHTLTPVAAPSSGALSSYLPPTIARPPATTDPQDLLRAMSRIDITRPQAQVGDAARRAVREVQRAHDAYTVGGLAERKLTDVPPPTPRKPPGTPRRSANTPGRR
ncbi:Mis12-Mtw1 protein family-domain-containing protein [Irpex rosettiformis]|uniref:Mis12-Mtw1 protein family-domain-containing protein n=1 Tax=Irpex rosettiformis TaxID=378272 RepID=A0ACB8U9V0_9APHY|nr:Mis12-Mtw1 protein family-domain-containing protein [Irpex rosettiformis]